MYTSHGHQIPGTPVEGDDKPSVARCGGPKVCKQCGVEAAFYRGMLLNDPNMPFKTFVRKPFTVQAIQVTRRNIDEIAKLIGTITEEDGKRFILVDRKLVPNVEKVWPGYWVTKMGDNIRCYSKRVFHDQFISTTPALEDWIRHIDDSARTGKVIA